ncbi:IS5 family transposase [Kibdelosporangium philippinense]|uniref:IS5 family transposase n=1 Tax=Kibdelosporangium philippinense TaxID=211113 RepID=A0ABS8Z9N9_9PSEU|nr:IS5 family transposase [Kibdelosporangium philippinense]MCE7001530.1 IS5 family transposase [Kibdelosporangium philippinense]MCE7001815.1 IS5 family transposase [Kibdelosporangium philippinense]MCE7002255.1 IS5 family transposase [Kibdelosporangium philippinense]MCE7002257.1 IS5 family transposase [Kibdelosporangium philippinense]MCE7002320.1 IS5 family transposase [Kibdelosporangium philippinense]
MGSRRAYRSDLSDARWALIEPTLTAWRAARRGPGTVMRVHDLREIVNAILYVCRTGIAWEYLPHDFPPCKTVYDYYAKWEADGTTETLHDLLRDQVRVAKGRAAAPTAAIIDSQSVKTSCNVSESSQGIDAGKKIKGRKRHIATDVLGLLLAVIVTAASVQDSAGGQQVLDHLAAAHPTVSAAWVDGGYNNTVIRHGAQRGIRVEVVKRPSAKGFHVLPRRWVVERSLGWLMQHRRLARDYEALPQRSRTMVHWAMTNIMSRTLTGESTQTWRNDPPKADILA